MIYYEYFFYFFFLIVEKIFVFYGLILFDVEEILIYGGLFRIYGKYDINFDYEVINCLMNLKNKEIKV